MVHHKKENTPKTLINIAFGNLFRGSEEDKVLRKHPADVFSERPVCRASRLPSEKNKNLLKLCKQKTRFVAGLFFAVPKGVEPLTS